MMKISGEMFYDVDKIPLNDLVSFIEGKQVAREATMTPSVNALSQFKKEKRSCKSSNPAPEIKEGRCIQCSKLFPLF